MTLSKTSWSLKWRVIFGRDEERSKWNASFFVNGQKFNGNRRTGQLLDYLEQELDKISSGNKSVQDFAIK